MNINRVVAATLAVVTAATLLSAGAAAAQVYDYDGVFATCTASCNAVTAWGAPGSSDNPASNPAATSKSGDIELVWRLSNE